MTDKTPRTGKTGTKAEPRQIDEAALDRVSAGAVGIPGAGIKDGTSNTILKP